MGMAPSTPTVQTPNAGQVGQSFSQLLGQLYGTTPQQVGQAQTYLPQFTNLATNNLNTAAGGVLQTYLNQILPGLQSASGNQTAGNIGTVGGQGSAAAAAIGSISPGTMGLTDLSQQTAQTQLEAANTGVLPANQADATLNAVNQNWASRGLGGSSGNQLADALAYYQGGQNNLSAAQSAAGSAANLGYSDVLGPALSLISPTLSTPGQALDLTGTNAGSVSAGAQSNLPSTSSIESLMNTVYNSQAGADISQANVSEAQNQAEGEFWSGIIGGAMGGM